MGGDDLPQQLVEAAAVRQARQAVVERQVVQVFLGDAPATGVEYRSSYAVATVLFVVTLGLTLVGNLILRRFREEYD
jgi:ABC-type phosphate transport system permease subunit